MDYRKKKWKILNNGRRSGRIRSISLKKNGILQLPSHCLRKKETLRFLDVRGNFQVIRETYPDIQGLMNGLDINQLVNFVERCGANM